MKTTKFQIFVFIIFIAFIIAGVTMFATYRGDDAENTIPAITVWGTFPKTEFEAYVNKVNNSLENRLMVRYVEYSQSTFLDSFIQALARGSGPDAILVPADVILSVSDKITVIPYDIYPQRTFMDSFVDQARVYLGNDGITAVPLSIDPMVMFWNRDLFNSAGIATPPRYWDDFTELNRRITIKDDNGTVTRSAVAMGDFSNVINARELLGSLLLQSGNPVTYFSSDGGVRSALSPSAPNVASPTQAVNFFTQFVDPSNANYSWNRSWPDSRTAFISGKLATYFGLASELFALRNKNPNLNFDVAPLPQLRNGGIKATYAKMYGFSIVRQSRLASAVLEVVATLTQPQFLVQLSNDLYLPSISRNIIASGSKDPYISIFNEGALISRTWRDADPRESSRIMGNMVLSVTTGQKSIYQALTDASEQYNVVLQQATGI